MPFTAKGKCSYFGGPQDMGVDPDEGLAFIYTVEDKSDLFLSYQPEGTTGLARRLNPAVPYVACRWPYDASNKEQWRDVLLTEMAMITNPANGKFVKAYPSDWGPHDDTNRVADLSEKVMEKLGLKTDDICEVIFPYTTRGEADLPRYKSIAISSGHSTKCQGANGYINEVEQATIVSDLLADKLRERGVEVAGAFHDLESTDQTQCLDKICDWHNDQARELDLSIHFNSSSGDTNQPIGCEVFWVTQEVLAAELSKAIASVGFKDRGAKYSDSFWFLNQTLMPSCLLEICFVNSTADCNLYAKTVDDIGEALATVLGGERKDERPPPELVPADKRRRRIFFRHRNAA